MVLMDPDVVPDVAPVGGAAGVVAHAQCGRVLVLWLQVALTNMFTCWTSCQRLVNKVRLSDSTTSCLLVKETTDTCLHIETEEINSGCY